MADINLERGKSATRYFTFRDRLGAIIDITGTTITIRYRRADGTGERRTGSVVLDSPANGIGRFTFPIEHFVEDNVEFHVRFSVTPVPATTNGEFPDGPPLTLIVWPLT